MLTRCLGELGEQIAVQRRSGALWKIGRRRRHANLDIWVTRQSFGGRARNFGRSPGCAR